MGQEQEYWQTSGKHPVMNEHVIGNGDTKEEATAKCIECARERQNKWQISSPDVQL